MSPSTAETKRALRTELKARRAALPPEVRRAAAERIAERLWKLPALADARRVFCYISFASEVDTHGILRGLLDRGLEVVVPRLVDREIMVAQRLKDWAALTPGPLGILAPPPAEPCEDRVDLALTPGLGFTLQGDRIGFGAGYYDRWFAAHAVGWRLALAYECQIVDHLPAEPTDQRVDGILTEARLVDCRTGDFTER